MPVIKTGAVNVADIYEDWMPGLQHLTLPHPNGNSAREHLHQLKMIAEKRFPRKTAAVKIISRDESSELISVKSFDGNIYSDNSPNDNDLAISNDGRIVAVANTTIFMYDSNADSLIKSISLVAFDQTGSSGRVCYDPKALYDPDADRFIIVWLYGSGSPNEIHLAFSQTNNPAGPWNYYKISGNPLNDGTWADYPMIAITKKELFLTVNSVWGGDWKTGFRGTLIYQMDKQSGYTGDSVLNSLLFDSIYYDNELVRNICPVKGGSYPLGPNIYFLSNRNFAIENDTVFLFELTDTIQAPNQQLNMKALKANHAYFLSPSARQSAGKNFDTNDSRVLGAFLGEGKIQYVHNSMDTSSGTAAIYHGVIHNLSGAPFVNSHIISDTVFDFGYPNISSTGTDLTDDDAIISFNHSGPNIFAGLSAVKFNGNNSYSKILPVKTGYSYVSIPFNFSNMERWGDYSGSQRRYDKPGCVWISGYYADSSKRNRTWIAELTTSNSLSITTENHASSVSYIYPNPVSDQFCISFELSQNEELTFDIYSSNGKLIKQLLKDNGKEGKNLFRFTGSALLPGTYFLIVTGKKGYRLREIIVQR